jgi:superfamily I DNA and/or RNA helicase
MKPIAIQAGKRILLIAGDPKQLENVELKKNPRANLVIVKKELDT